MHETEADGATAVDAYQRVCGAAPTLVRRGRPESGLCLYRWGIQPVREAVVPRIREVTLTVHLAGAPRVRVFAENGLTRRYSRPGDITLIPRGQSIHWLVDGGADFATVHIPVSAGRFLGDPLLRELIDLSECLFAFRDDFALASARALIQASALGGESANRYASQLLETLALHVSRVLKGSDAERIRLSQQPQRIARRSRDGIDFGRLRELIEQRLSDSLTIDVLAGALGVGRSRFCELFVAHFGTSPHQYVLRRRIERAQQLIRTGRRSLTDVAYEVGFSSAAHFSTAFKACTGGSPNRFAESVGCRGVRRARPAGVSDLPPLPGAPR